MDATASASIVVDQDLRYGTTEYIANMIAKEVGGDLHRIETVTPFCTHDGHGAGNSYQTIADASHANTSLPEYLEDGQKTFENGDITYCEAHHNMAIFYAQTDDPILSVDVIAIGRIKNGGFYDEKDNYNFALSCYDFGTCCLWKFRKPVDAAICRWKFE